MADVSISNLSADLEKKAEEELQEKVEWRERDILALKDIVLSSNIGLNACMEDRFLLRFLRARKFDYDKAFELIVKYYSSRCIHPTLFKNFLPSSVKHVFENNFQGFLTKRDDDGRLVLVYRAGMWDPEKCTVDDIFRANYMSLEAAIEDEITQVNGIVAIVDLQGLRLNQLKHFTPSYLKKVISVVQESFPARFKAFHIVHESTLVDMIFPIVRAFLNPKIKDRIHFHGNNLASLHNHVPCEILPVELGGRTGLFNNSDWFKALSSKEVMFSKRNEYGFVGEFNVQQLDSFRSFFGAYKRVCID